MYSKIKKIQYSTLLISLILIIGGCDESFLNKEPLGVTSFENLNSVQGVDALLIGAYSLTGGAGSLSGWPGYAYPASVRDWVWDMASDDSYKGSTQGDFNETVERYEALPTEIMLEHRWFVMYDGVSRSNDVLNALEGARENMESENALIIEAQAKWLRAWFHFRLQKMHFQIPYITENIDQPELVPNDHPVWNEIEQDLQFAIDHLPESFPGEPGRVTRWAALAVKAYVHLFQKEHGEAKPLLDEIINSGQFDLVENFYDNHYELTEHNLESIWEVEAAVNDGTSNGINGNPDSWTTNPFNRFLPTCCGMYQPSQDLVNAFKVDEAGLPLLGVNGPKYNDENLKNDMGIASSDEFIPTGDPVDPRLDWTVGRRGIPYLDWGIHTGNEWIRSQVNGGPYNTKKQMYYRENAGIASHAAFARATAINFRKYRFAHILLWRAEVAVEENDLETARELVNRIRRRASNQMVMGKVSTTVFDESEIEVDWTQPAANYLIEEYPAFPNQEYARAAVIMETRLETALEGNRFFDLVRWGIDQEVLSEFIINDQQIRSKMQGASYNSTLNSRWPIPQSQIDLQRDVLVQDPAW
jgi:hypothetical protein